MTTKRSHLSKVLITVAFIIAYTSSRHERVSDICALVRFNVEGVEGGMLTSIWSDAFAII